MHYIELADGTEELYLLDSDPEERINRAGSPIGRMAIRGLRQSLTAMLRRR